MLKQYEGHIGGLGFSVPGADAHFAKNAEGKNPYECAKERKKCKEIAPLFKAAGKDVTKKIKAMPLARQGPTPLQPNTGGYAHARGGAYSDGDVFNINPAHQAKYSCAQCGKSKVDIRNLAPGRRLKSCPCGKVSYCDDACQKAHWKVHKAACEARPGKKEQPKADAGR